MKLFWVQNLVLEPNLILIQAFFKKWQSETAQLHGADREARKAGIVDFNNELAAIREKIVNPMEIVKCDTESLDSILNDLADLVSDDLSNDLTPQSPDWSFTFSSLRNQFLAELHQCQLLI